MANELLDAVNWAWRKFANPTLPSPGTKHEPAKEDIFAFGELLQSEVDAAKSLAVSGAVGFETEAAMNGDLDHDAGTIARGGVVGSVHAPGGDGGGGCGDRS